MFHIKKCWMRRHCNIDTVNLTGSRNHMRDKPLAMSVKGNSPSPPRPGPTLKKLATHGILEGYQTQHEQGGPQNKQSGWLLLWKKSCPTSTPVPSQGLVLKHCWACSGGARLSDHWSLFSLFEACSLISSHLWGGFYTVLTEEVNLLNGWHYYSLVGGPRQNKIGENELSASVRLSLLLGDALGPSA